MDVLDEWEEDGTSQIREVSSSAGEYMEV